MFTILETKTREEIDALHERSKTNLTPTKETLFDYSQSGQYRDVHTYDTQGEQLTFPTYAQEEKTQALRHLQTLFRNGMATCMLNIMLNRNNYDPLNKVDCADMLFWICSHPITPELFYLLEEQIADNGSLGTCLMGSSHRIRQIYYAQSDLVSTNISNPR